MSGPDQVPKPPPPASPDRHYSFRGMNLVFAISSLGLLAVTLWMVFADYARPWKRLQAEFRGLEHQKLEVEAEQERQLIDQEQLTAINQDIAQQEARLVEQRGEIEELEGQLSDAEASVYELDAEWRKTKSLLDTARYEYEMALQGGEEAAADEAAEVAELRAEFQETRVELEGARSERDAIQERLDGLRGELDDAEKRLVALREGYTNLQDRMASLDKGLDYFVLNAPLFDFLEPTLKIEQVLLEGLYLDMNFTTVDRVDRCMTCHVASNRSGFEPTVDGEAPDDGWHQPFQSHPRLDLFVGDTSPHPYNRFGCTVCHQGLDRATDFARAGHSPVSEEQKEQWKDEWSWEAQKYLDHPILPAGMGEAGCISCHSGEVWTPGSEVQDTGRLLIGKMGCYGCHVIDYEPYRDLRRAGPDLRAIASKTDPEWAYKWIEAPRDFRPTSWMPHFFYLENIKGEDAKAKQEAEIAGLVDYLWDTSDGRSAYPEPPAGDAASGQALFESVGCTGCHILDGEATRADFFPDIRRLHGPNLVGTGSKVSSGWLYAWLKDPKQYFPETNMPSLRLTDQEAADLTAYLMQQRQPDFEGGSLPETAEQARRDLVLEYLQQTMTVEQSQARVEGMSVHEESVYLGRMTINKYGCFGCHQIAGFEDAKPIGTELTEEGSKPLHQFDFGHVHDVPHTRHDWIFTKLKRPRIWDYNKEEVKEYGELYKMPDFGMSDEEAQAVLTNVLGFTTASVRPERKAGQGPGGDVIAAGRKLVTRYNCRGCHLVEGQGRAIADVLEAAQLPPNLASQGSRTQSDWLFSFLHDPGQVQMRPWLEARMPTFGFSDEQANTVVGYFSALEQETPFLSPAPQASARDRAVGEVAFTMLQCARCHPSGPAASAATGVAPTELAPSLLLAQERLRWDWVADWILDPQSYIPGTNMPANFPPADDGEGYTTPFAFIFDTPVFEPNKRALMPYFESEDEMRAYFDDAEKVAAAIRDHIWTLR